MRKERSHKASLAWTGNLGTGTTSYHAYSRDWQMGNASKMNLVACSNDPLLGGDRAKHNPEELLLAALGSCHMLWYLHLASVSRVIVVSYEDEVEGLGFSKPDGSGEFEKAILRPRIAITEDSPTETAFGLHEEVHKYCFIARSVKFPVAIEPTIKHI